MKGRRLLGVPPAYWLKACSWLVYLKLVCDDKASIRFDRFRKSEWEERGDQGLILGLILLQNRHMQSKLPLCCPVASYTTKYDMLNDIYV